MSVLIDKSTRLLVQGLTGREGTFHAKAAQAYGTNVVGGVTPGKGGTTHEGWPVFDTVAEPSQRDRRQRVGHLRAAAGGADAVMEAADAGLALAVCITEGIPTIDMMRALASRAADEDAAGRSELPGHHHRRAGQGRHHPGPHLQAGPRRHRLEERHADLRGDPSAHRPGPGADDLHRHRRRPADRHVVHRRAGGCSARIRRPKRSC